MVLSGRSARAGWRLILIFYFFTGFVPGLPIFRPSCY
ncbi:hypothetical protein MED297_07481 [Reinekea sp. MED297]|uniref:Uncharacterized protein n=1 Tax=Reinekea blandensis MED297 TaxID=314283 RepID=A4BII7_9GAMM|nr:hypothetical protein MED297_07481 [Reinekea sp. MED297] [Reinekea blandensis MED297]